MKFLDGYKTIIGTVGYVICEGVKNAFPEYTAVADMFINIVFIPMGVWGIAHKIQKSGVPSNG